MKLFSYPAVKRKLICVLMGIGFGFLCAYLSSSGMEKGVDFWWTPLMWAIVFNRFLIGLFVYFAGAINYNPWLKWRWWSWLRGFVVGAIVSIDMAIGIFMSPTMSSSEALTIFWMIILAGAVYGLLIDLVATKVAGDGKKFIEGWAK